MSDWVSTAAFWVFWACLFLVLYSYLLYPLLLFLAYAVSQVRRDWQYLTTRRNRRRNSLPAEELPTVSIILAAYNEEACLKNKIANIRQLKYPREKIEVVIVSDGSTDRTNEILRALSDPDIRVVMLPVRRGKSNAVNRAVEQAQHDILVCSDASTLFDAEALGYLMRHFVDPTVGVVCGSLEFRRTLESQQTEGVYWKYESILRLMEGRLNATLTASGAIYALRRRCFTPVMPNTLIEDFVIPMNARKLGYRVLYDPEAIAMEDAPGSVTGEFTRRVRLAIGSFRALREFFSVPLGGFAWLAFFCHKLLRWIVPFMLIGLFVSNTLLLRRPLYQMAFVGQLLVYAWASFGYLFRDRLQRVRFGLVGYFLLAMNLAFLVGFFSFLFGREEGTWEKAR
jgi:cellulose synthase/poly-beta-1,6-N-acetylglucosamine synthase-like glycosyltransferase